MRASYGYALLLALAAPWPARAGIVSLPAPAEARCTATLSKDEKCTYGAHNGHQMASRDITLNTGKTNYAIRWNACVDPAHGGRTAWIEGYLGMPAPSSANWYHSGFLFLNVNGEDVGTYRPTTFAPTESGRRAAVDVVWPAAAGPVRARFVALPGEDALFLEIRLEPKQPPKSIALRLHAFPSAFTSWLKIKGDRTITTPARVEHQTPWEPAGEKPPPARTVPLEPAKDWWVLYSDGVCDVARGQGVGPCALLFLPEQIRSAEVSLTDYPVLTNVSADPAARSLRGRTNAQALEYVKQNAARCRTLLEKLDFTNAGLADLLDGKAELEIAHLLRGSAGAAGPEAQAYLADLNAALERARATRQAGGALSIAEEDALLALLRKQEEILEPVRWKLLFDE